MKEQVVLVTPDDEILGLMDKMQAHENGLLHRAFSVFLFNDKGEMLLQKRAATKYHSPNLWTNAVCSHPRANETYLEGAHRRLKEELGISNLVLTEQFHFIYKADVGDGLWEHELDYVFVGEYNGDFNLNPDEVSEVKYCSIETLEHDMAVHPEHYTEWFKIILSAYRTQLNSIT
ncbi:isopentenyl-diphosphate Delta-isomerase [Riemerella columbina]|uniref:isopentenyl-diphosphate Delta-isomerase n=1 Tax=Riemerella columbina TaxID=103810 RepID=UPI00035C9D90|nr:isopentenyl-diphosphate Delta-isomerase [Riemerella columbina]